MVTWLFSTLSMDTLTCLIVFCDYSRGLVNTLQENFPGPGRLIS